MMDLPDYFGQLEAAKYAREAEAHHAQVSLPFLLSGDATWCALKQAIEDMTRLAPEDHDILIRVGDICVLQARFVEPHTFLFEGFDQHGLHAGVVIHFSQLHARIVYLPKRGPSRVITGFGNATVA